MGTRSGWIARLARCPRRAAAVLLWVYACASVLGGLHLALEAHELCAHGELTHAADPCATADGAAPGAPRADEAGARERGDAHHHCEWVARACQGRAAGDAHGVRAPQRECAPQTEPHEERAHGSVPLLALAPHHGPPRRVRAT